MIPILYESYETEFTSNGLGRLRDAVSVVVTEERNSVYECDFSYPVDGVNYDRIQLGRVIAVKHDESNDVQPFDIVSCSRPINGLVEYHAVHISYRQSAMTTAGITGINTLTGAFDYLSKAYPENPFIYESDIETDNYLASADGIPRSVRSILGGVEGSLLDTYGGEYEWDKWTVRLWKERGQDRNFTIRYGLNMTEYKEELDYSEAYTAVVPYWAGTGDNGSNIVVKGSMIDSGQRLYGHRANCVPLDVTDKFQNKPTVADVNNAGKNYMALHQTYLPQQSITVDFVRLTDSPEYANFAQLQVCKLCDKINVVFPRYNMSGKFKIVKTVYDVLNERYTEMELGTLSTSLAGALGVTSGNNPSSNNIEQAAIVKEIGTSGSWKWRKWSDNKVEAWANVTASARTGSVWGSMYYSDISVSIPDGIFENVPTRAYAVSGNSQWWVVGIYSLAVDGCTVRMVHPNNSSQAISINLYIVYG